MSKRAEEAALKAYPPTYTTVKRHAKRVQSELVDTHKPVRAIFQQGYEQAEKDLALTWEDMDIICELFSEVECKYPLQTWVWKCREVLRLFLKYRIQVQLWQV